MNKSLIWIGVFIGSTLGGLVPGLWHASWLSLWGVTFSTLGGLAGIWLAWKAGQRWF